MLYLNMVVTELCSTDEIIKKNIFRINVFK
jgi:hypothetical protein